MSIVEESDNRILEPRRAHRVTEMNATVDGICVVEMLLWETFQK